MEVGCVTAELAHGFLGSIFWHGYEVRSGPEIDARSVPMHIGKCFGDGFLRRCLLLRSFIGGLPSGTGWSAGPSEVAAYVSC